MSRFWPTAMQSGAPIFIAYREVDSAGWAAELAARLREAFGQESVFLDKDAMALGDWRSQLDAAIRASKVVIVIIGPAWVCDALFEENDVHCSEVALALSLTNSTTVIPITVNNASVPEVGALPQAIQKLPDKQARSLSVASEQRRSDVERLVCEIERITSLVARKPKMNWSRWLTFLVTVAVASGAGLAVLLVATVALGYYLEPGQKQFLFWSIFIVVALIRTVRRSGT